MGWSEVRVPALTSLRSRLVPHPCYEWYACRHGDVLPSRPYTSRFWISPVAETSTRSGSQETPSTRTILGVVEDAFKKFVCHHHHVLPTRYSIKCFEITYVGDKKASTRRVSQETSLSRHALDLVEDAVELGRCEMLGGTVSEYSPLCHMVKCDLHVLDHLPIAEGAQRSVISPG